MTFDPNLDFVQQHMIPLSDTPPFVVCDQRRGPTTMGKKDICFLFLWPVAFACFFAFAFHLLFCTFVILHSVNGVGRLVLF